MKYAKRTLALIMALLTALAAVPSLAKSAAEDEERVQVMELDKKDYAGQLIETDLPSGIYDDGHTLILHPGDGGMIMTYDPDTDTSQTYYENGDKGTDTRSPDGGFPSYAPNIAEANKYGAKGYTISSGYLAPFGDLASGSIPISNAVELYNIRYNGNKKSYHLTRDIDVSDLAHYGVTWEPINVADITFDGRGHTVRGLTDSLFGGAYIVKNVTVIINASNCGGGIANTISGQYSAIYNCVVKGSISSGDDGICGGVVGRAYALGAKYGVIKPNAAISFCINYATINGSEKAGGIIGHTYYSAPSAEDVCSSVTVYKCVNKGSVTCQKAAGGIVGYYAQCDIDECRNEARVISTGSPAAGETADLYSAGGIAGAGGFYNRYEPFSITNCTNFANVSGYCASGISPTKNTYYFKIINCKNTGNIIGVLDAFGIGFGKAEKCANFGSVSGGRMAYGIGSENNSDNRYYGATRCFNAGNITANGEYTHSYAAGIGGHQVIAYCCSLGSVSAHSSAGSAYASGIGLGSYYGISYCDVRSNGITAETTASGYYAYAGAIDAYMSHSGGAPHYFGCFKCDTPNISASAPQANKAFAGAFIGYNNDDYGNGVRFLATNYCMTNSALPFSGRSQVNPSAYNIYHIDSLSHTNKQVLVKVVNKENGMPLKNAVVNCDGIKVNTDENGIAKVPVYYNRVLLLAVSKNNFECKKIIDPALDVMQVVELAYDGVSDGQQHDYVTLPTGEDITIPSISSAMQDLFGPDLSFIGKTSPAYKVEIGIDLPMGTMYSLYNSEDDTLKVVFGVKLNSTVNSEGYSQIFNDDFNAVYDSIYGLAHNLPKNAEKSEGMVGLDCEFQLVGYMLLSLSDKTGMQLEEGGAMMKVEITVPVAKAPFWGIFYAKIEISGSYEGEIKLELAEGNIINCTSTASFGVDVTGALGVNIIELAKAEFGLCAGMELKLEFPFESLVDSVEINADLSAYVYARALLFHEKKTWELATAQLWPLPFKDGEPAIDVGSVLNNENMTPEPRDYLKESGMKSGGEESLVLSGVYPDGSPRLAELSDGRLVLVWAHDDGTRTDMNRTAIYYSVCDNGVWSAPAILWDDGTADFSPATAVDGSDLHIVWQNITEVMPDDAQLEYALGKTELCHTVLHADGSIDIPETICADGNFQSKITAAADNGKVCVSWLENADNDIWCSSEDIKLYYTELDNGEWSEPALAGSGVVDAVCGYKDGELEIAYIFNSKVSAQDPAYYDIYRFTRTGNQLLVGNSVEDSHPQIIGGEICWMQDGVLRNTSKSLGLAWDGEVRLAEAQDGTLTAFMLGSGEDFNTEIVTSVYDAQANEWSPIVPLTNYGGAVNWFCPIVLADGNIAAALTESPLTGDDDIFGTASIRVLVGASFTDLMLTDGISYDFDTAAPGGDITLTCTVLNNSLGAVDGLTVNIYDENDTLVDTQILDEYLASGESRGISFDYTLPDPLSLATLRAEILPALVTDDEISNNSAEFTVGMSDIALHAALLTEDADGALITAYVINEGFDTAEDVTCELVYGGADGETLGTLALGNIAPGGTRDVSFAVPAEYLENSSEFDWNYFTIRVNTESPQAHYYNDYSIVHDEATRAEGVEITSAPAQLYVFDTYALAANVLPADAANRQVTWLSGDTSVMTVDENGVVTAASSGTATIYAVSNDGGFIDSIELTAVYRQYTASFVDHDGTVLASVTVNEGDPAEAPEDPEREGYAFVGWDIGFDELHEDIIVTAQYEICVYEIYYYILDELYLVEEYEYGAPVTATAAPENDRFISWGELPENMPAHDIVAEAIMEPLPPDITPGDLDGDGAVSFNDIAMLYLFLIGDGNIDAALIQNADFNGDGQPTYADITDMYISLIS